jgi:hypothetical protein
MTGVNMSQTPPEGQVPEDGQAASAPADEPTGDLARPAAEPVTPDEDRLATALRHLAESAEKTLAEQQVIAHSARAMAEERRRGRSWAAILAGVGQPSILTLLGSSLRRLSQTSSRVRTGVATALANEGLSTRQIAAHLGVTHQRVSAMLNRPKS